MQPTAAAIEPDPRGRFVAGSWCSEADYLALIAPDDWIADELDRAFDGEPDEPEGGR